MPDPDSRTFLYTPGWIWDAIFKIVQLAVVAYFGNSAVDSIRTNGKQQVEHAEAQLAKQDKVIAKQEEVRTAVVENTAETAQVKEAAREIPVAAAIAAKVVVEQKEGKGPE